jgi:hypothetical protein
VRRGSVVVANALGSGLVESGAMAPFLPALAQRLLGEKLELPSVTAWWCGGDKERQHVIANLDSLVIKRAFPRPGAQLPVFGERLSAVQRAELTETIRARPGSFLAQERINLSTAPVWKGGNLEPHCLMLRVFLAAYDDGYVAMPGGLTRVAAERGGTVVSMQEGGGSKDTWVLAAQQARPGPALRAVELPAKLVRGAHDLPSRVAETLYWFGRNVERAEDTTRLLRAALSRAGSTGGFGSADKLPVAIGLLSRLYRIPDTLSQDEKMRVIASASFDASQSYGLRKTIERVHRAAAMSRDRLSLDTWRAVNRLQQELNHPGPHLNMEDVVNTLNSVVLACEALSGLFSENMTRGLGWHFVDIGRRLERGVHVLGTISGAVLQ